MTLPTEKLAQGDFDKITAYVPGASNYMESAKTLGTVTGPLKNFAGLNGALGKLGMKPQQQAQFAPTLSLTLSANQAAATCSRCSRPRSSRRSERR